MDRIVMKKKFSLGYFDTKANDDTWVRLGSFSKLQVWVDDSMMEDGWLEVEVVDTSVRHGRSPQRVKRVLNVQLSVGDFKNAFHIDMTQLDHRYGGRGIAAKAYRYIIKKLGITLQAGTCQSQGGRKVWFDLAQINDLNVYTKSKFSKSYVVGIDEEEREVWHPTKEIYDGMKEMYVFAESA
jgi:hypothetical protein|tara:strand:- start:383 stop:928 length:546 start_codon:yes stop_codon:yes gene_type:complete